MNCQICNRPLNNPQDPLSVDCGGDCWGCIGEIESKAGYKPSVDIVQKEYELGVRTILYKQTIYRLGIKKLSICDKE